MIENTWIPATVREHISPKQAAFLAFDGREAIYGGAAGGGKSYALLIGALQHVDEPGYHALILRRTYKQLAKADSIMATALEWFGASKSLGVHWTGDDHKLTFPSGATVEFGHMEYEKNKFDYQGAAYHFVGYDELTQFEEAMYTYLFSRQRRRVDSPIPIRMRSASNPGGIGHDWVKKRFIDEKSRKPHTVFIPALLQDNPNIDQAAYIESLAELDPITRAQLLAGDWDAYQGGRFLREWFGRYRRHLSGHRLWTSAAVAECAKASTSVEHGQHRYVERLALVFQTCDPAASEKTTADYTVTCTWGMTQDCKLLLLDCLRFQKAIPDIPPLLLANYRQWKPSFIAIESVAANSAVYQLCSRLPMIVNAVSPMGNDKLIRATGAMNLAKDGRVLLPLAAPWLEDVESEILRFTGDDKKDDHDDIVDNFSYAADVLQGRIDGSGAGFRPYVAGAG